MKDSNELQNALRHFTGSETWTRHGMNKQVLATDGALFFFENAGGGAFWLWDIIATELTKFAKKHGMVYLTFVVTGTKGLITLDDGGANSDDGESKTEFWRRVIDFTDTPEGEWKLWLAWDDEHVIVLLPSEY